MRDVLTVSDVAKIRGTDRTSAFRWLQRNAKKHLRKRGRGLVIDAAVFAALQADKALPLDPRIARRLEDVESVARECTRRLDRHAEALRRAHLLGFI